MQRRFLALTASSAALLAALASSPAHAADIVLLDEDFNNLSQWTDLSLAPQWGGFTTPLSAFTTTTDAGNSVVQLTPAALSTGQNISSPTGLRSFTALDHQFSQSIDHATSTVTIDFRMRWTTTETGTGERGRFIVSLVHDYPSSGLDTTYETQPGSKVRDFTDEWWARPAYQVRLRSGTTAQGDPILQYGGGNDPQGEWEIYKDAGDPTVPDWWLPSFNAAPGGGAPGSDPDGGSVRLATSVASTAFRDFRYVITPTEQTLYANLDADPDLKLIGSQSLLAEPRYLDDQYHYFDTFQGIRLYFNGGEKNGQFYNNAIDHLSVTLTPTPIPEPTAALLLFGGGFLLLGRRSRGR